MPQSTRRPRRARISAPALLACALLATSAAHCATAQLARANEFAPGTRIHTPTRLPAVEDAPATYPTTSAAWFNSNIASASTSLGLVNHQEELPPGAAVPENVMDFEEDVIPLDFGTCASCGADSSCACGKCCADYCDGWHHGKFFWGFYSAICSPDPCYDPCWWALADAAFFVDAARPVTQTRLRWDAGIDFIFPDRAEYFWARSGGGGLGPANVERSLRVHELSHYTEVAHGGFSAFFVTPYRSYDAVVNPHEAGFSDLVAGTKSMLLDCELIQLTLQMKFITPTGVSTKGLGTGHLSIEPSLLLGLNLSTHSYLQAQVAEWIPIGGNEQYAGALLHYHFSYNRTLLGCPGHIQVIGTTELNGWSFQDGAYSDPDIAGAQRASNYTYLSSGVGLRTIICDRVDFGLGVALALTEAHWAEQQYRSELRIRF